MTLFPTTALFRANYKTIHLSIVFGTVSVAVSNLIFVLVTFVCITYNA